MDAVERALRAGIGCCIAVTGFVLGNEDNEEVDVEDPDDAEYAPCETAIGRLGSLASEGYDKSAADTKKQSIST